MAWVFLAGAIISEVSASMSLKAATVGSKRWYGLVLVGYLVAFTLLSFSLEGGIGLGVAYGIWAAAGVALTAALSRFAFKEPLTPVMGLGIVLIAGGVLLVEVGASAH